MVKLVGILFLLFAVLSIIHGIFSLPVSFREGRFGFNYEPEPPGSLKITGVVKGYPAKEAGLLKDDIIRKVNRVKITKKNADTVFGNAFAGSTMVLTVQRGDQMLDLEMTRQLMPLLDRVIRVLFLLVLPCIMLAFVLVGLWGTFKHPSFITNLIGLVCFFFGGMVNMFTLTMAISPISQYLGYYTLRAAVMHISIAMAPAFWLYLFLNFPQRSPLFSRHKRFITSAVFFLPVLMTLADVFIPSIFKGVKFMWAIMCAYIAVYLILGIVVLARGARRVNIILRKRQYQLILFGIKYGSISFLVGMGSLALYQTAMGDWPNILGWIVFVMFLVTQVVSLIVPFTFLNSFLQHRILETESALKRRLRYIAASAGLFLVYMVTAFYLGNWLVAHFNLKDTSIIVLVVLALALTFTPLNNGIQRRLEQKLYPEKTKYKNALKEMIKRMTGYIEESQVLENLSRWLSETMGISPIYAVSMDGLGSMKIPLHVKSKRSVVAKIKDGSNFYWDELWDGSNTHISIEEDEKKWAKKKGISITVPMISRGEPVGLLSIGKKKNNEDFTGDDLEIFQEAAYHTAVALQNIKLQTEHLEKKRMDRELKIARDIQDRLMPRKIPEVDGLLLHGEYHPCFQVGGDYFDIIPMNNNRTALAIADVSGKGTGAALLMSNLQACLRMAISLEVPLHQIVYRINNIIFENSLPFQFITFFMGIWNPGDSSFEYINAGHNPPLLLCNNDEPVKKCGTTGIGLGIKKDQDYEIEQIELRHDDVLAIYTDGIEEYFNHRLEAFGIERMISAIREKCGGHPKDIVEHMFDRLKEFADGEEAYHCDDLTIIVAKRVENSGD